MAIDLQNELNLQPLRGLRPPAIRRAIVRTLRKAGSTALRDMRSEASKRVRQRKRIKAGVVRKALRVRRAKGSDINSMEWALDVASRPMRVADYPHRQTKRGVSVAINRGKRSLIRHAFKVTMPSGHRGVFIRRGKNRFPIDEKLASRVIDAVSYPEEIRGIHRRGQESFARRFNALLGTELDRTR